MPSLTTYGLVATAALVLGVAAMMFQGRDDLATASSSPDASLPHQGAGLASLPSSSATDASSAGRVQAAAAALASSPAARGGSSLLPIPETLGASGPARVNWLHRLQQRHPEVSFFRSAEDVESARQQTAVYGPATAESVAAQWGLTEKQKTDGRSFIRYDLRTLESRVEGDTVDLWLPKVGSMVKAQIEQVESIDGLLRWSGQILDLQEGGRFTITHASGDQYAVGTIETPFGHFSLQSKSGVGWITSTQDDFHLPPDGNDGVVME